MMVFGKESLADTDYIDFFCHPHEDMNGHCGYISTLSVRGPSLYVRIRFQRIKSISALKELKYFQWSLTHNIGIQITQKGQAETFMVISNLKSPIKVLKYCISDEIQKLKRVEIIL